MALGKRGEVEFKTATRVGQAGLEPGHYRFQHEMAADGRHMLVVRARATVQSSLVGQHYAGKTSEQLVARIPCEVVTLDKKLGSTEIVQRTDDDGVPEVRQIRIAGERTGHIPVLAHTS